MPDDARELPGGFATTRWSLVARAGGAGGREALEELCRLYWAPVFAYVRRRTRDEEEARDRTQAFFADLLERASLATADAGRGRFRAFLLGCARNFLARARRDETTEKRGGGRAPASFVELGEQPGVPDEAERAFEREWALTLLERALDRLRMESERAGRSALFEALMPRLGGGGGASTEELAARLGLRPASVRVAAHRLRGRYGELLRAEVRDTVASEAEVEDELRALFRAVGR